ncbi:MAG: 50S ribosomal protein L1 [Alphaproteobacteria bacterium]
MIKVNSKKKNENSSLKIKGGKRIRAARENINNERFYNIDEALELIKDSKVKFDETVEVAMQLGVDPKHSDQMVRGMVQMPNGTGKTVKVAVLTKAEKQEEGKKAGADIVGAEDLIEQIESGNINFDVMIATPDMMSIVGKVAKILGPKGLMPNPKLGTVTVNIADAVKAAKAGQVEFRVEKAGIVHAAFGKISFASEKLKENLVALVNAVVKARPTGAKGTYLKRIYLSSTMGASINLDISSIV